LERYWEEMALPQAAHALRACGMLPNQTTDKTGMNRLFPRIERPSPLQALAERLPVAEGPQLLVVEDLTGAGKTEAALVLAQRLIARGVAEGLYMGLPTMATANAMFTRVHDAYRRLYADDASPSLVLAHGKARLSDLFRQLISGWRVETHGHEEDSGTTSRLWIADNRKKALLASVGVGTIDQALLAALPVRHQSLRLFGLCRNVLIVDEVHACDAYMHKLLRGLLQFHASLGGSAILLSATLPKSMRRELVESFCHGMGYEAPELQREDYPLLTLVSADGAMELPFEPRVGSPRTVNVRFSADVTEIVARLKATAESGHCACWVRNSVSDAIEGERLVREAGVSGVELFHARFAMGDRLDLEERIKRRYGEESGPAERAGHVLVATQVVEQSLDLDFDLVVTDLAPVDRIVQRAGRLCRHARDATGRRVAGPDGRGTPVLWIYGPPLVEQPANDWFSGFFPAGAAVYRNHGQIWLTARLLAERGDIRLPEAARALIEGVYATGSCARVPPGLVAAQSAHDGREKAKTSIAAQDVLKLELGYDAQQVGWFDEKRIVTRLGEESVTLRLARWNGGELMPWYDAEENAWALSDVAVRCAAVGSVCLAPDEEKVVKEARMRMPDAGRWCLVVPLRPLPNGEWVAPVADARGRPFELRYRSDVGLSFVQPDQAG
jgi:CRISPR-associated endonuclease/helicase Cas3